MLLINLMFALQYPAYKVASDSMGIGALNVWTFAISCLALAPFLYRQRRTAAPQPLQSGEGGWRDFLLLAAVGVIPPSVIMSWGIAHSTASNAAILSLSIPVLMVLMSIVILGERLQRFFLVSLTLALAGTALISWSDIAAGNFSGGMLSGNLAIFVGGAGSAFYNTFGKKLLTRYSELETLFYGNAISLLFCAAISMLWDPTPFYRLGAFPLAAWAGVVVLGALSWGLAMVIWMWLLKQMTIAQISASVYMLPVLGVIVSAIGLHERLGLLQLAGGAVVLASAYFSTAHDGVQN